ncbi:DUF892 family protein [Aliifodinibius sp. S!AR15-10]|uniref:YciE/YciF ferroxidase family protein n=1 Tax=Aliifodinibius sp. S!AR15-10 TaxID=2950437 RepID=UPI00286651F3|nr:DUF892 family protein [Aliifodinibius sp. S!AR15-10]MDR8393250.1 DUF892 family protein [Aliifodinibius sp. S!AR15-10]
MKQVESTKDLYLEYLKDIYSAEVHTVVALHFFEHSASEDKLKKLIHNHTGETRLQVLRMEEVIDQYDDGLSTEHCRSMKTMIEEAKELVKRCTPGGIRDLAILGSIKRINQCKIMVYQTLIEMGSRWASTDETELLELNLREERAFYDSIDTMSKLVTD